MIHIDLLAICIWNLYAQSVTQFMTVIDKTSQIPIGSHVCVLCYNVLIHGFNVFVVGSVVRVAEKYGLKLLEFKREPAELGRLYFVYQRL